MRVLSLLLMMILILLLKITLVINTNDPNITTRVNDAC